MCGMVVESGRGSVDVLDTRARARVTYMFAKSV